MKKALKWIGFVVFVFVLFMSLTTHPSTYHGITIVEATDAINTTLVCFFIYVLFRDFKNYMKGKK